MTFFISSIKLFSWGDRNDEWKLGVIDGWQLKRLGRHKPFQDQHYFNFLDWRPWHPFPYICAGRSLARFLWKFALRVCLNPTPPTSNPKVWRFTDKKFIPLRCLVICSRSFPSPFIFCLLFCVFLFFLCFYSFARDYIIRFVSPSGPSVENVWLVPVF